jgi:RHS repeat-associated protein
MHRVAALTVLGTWRESYTPFGETLVKPAANDNRRGYTGHVADSGVNLIYMQARYYDPATARFLSPDPIGYRDGLGLYVYVGGDPVNKTDPTGMCAEDSTKPCWRDMSPATGTRISGHAGASMVSSTSLSSTNEATSSTGWTSPVPGYTRLNRGGDPGPNPRATSQTAGGRFGDRRRGSTSPGHRGVDFAAPVGASVVAAHSGIVRQVAPDNNDAGARITMEGPPGTFVKYFHLMPGSASVRVGSDITLGQPIARVGVSGNTPDNGAPHLHFEVRRGAMMGTAVDPCQYVSCN